MKLHELFLFYLILFTVTASFGDASRFMKKNIFKSIKSEDGDVIDCVDIARQPAFDHPLLKHHTIQMMPSDNPERLLFQDDLKSINNVKEITQTWQLSGECPKGTIPIRRTDKKRATSIRKKHPRQNIPKMFASSSVNTDALVQYRHEYALAYPPRGSYYGAKATISVWRPHVERNPEFSLSQFWISAGSGATLNTIEVGWTVDPELFGDNRTRLFVYWTRDNYQSTGCYNLLCSGFVQTNNRMALGGAVSTTGNNPQVTLLVWQDKNQHRWWLQYNGSVVGYWPYSIYTLLNGSSASVVEWGGEIINSNINGVHTTTQMGSGRFPQAGLGKASYFRNLQVVDSTNTLRSPPSVASFASNPTCYNVTLGMNSGWGNFFYYGGPGRNPNCP